MEGAIESTGAMEVARNRLEDIHAGVESMENAIARTRRAIIAFDIEGCWRTLGYSDLRQCLMSELRVGQRRVIFLLNTARIERELIEEGAPTQTSNAALKRLGVIEDSKLRAEVATKASELSGSDHYDSRHVKAAVDRLSIKLPERTVKRAGKSEEVQDISEVIESSPERVRLAMESKPKYVDLLSRLDVVRQLLTKLSKEPGGEFIGSSLRDDVSDLRKRISDCAPHAICPICDGIAARGCNACRGTGYVPLSIFTLIPAEERIRAVQRRKAKCIG